MSKNLKKRYFVIVLVSLGLFSGLYISSAVQFIDDVILDLTGLSSTIYIDGDNAPRADSFIVDGANFSVHGIWDSNIFTIEDSSDNIILRLTPSGGTADLSFSSANISDVYIDQWTISSTVNVDYVVGVLLANQDYVVKVDGSPIAGSPFNSGALAEISFSYNGGGVFAVEPPPCEDHELWGYAWSENIGWISFSCPVLDSGVDYGVDIDEANDRLEGYAWSENIGWIDFNATGIDVSGGTGSLSGWARACSVFQVGCSGALRPLSETGGWDGWISLDGAEYQVTLNSGPDPSEFENYAWGGDVVGWVSFNSSNTDGPVSYAVMTNLSLNADPTAINLNVTNSSYCFSTSPPIFLNWTFSDPNPGDTQVSYQIEVDNNSDFSSPEITDSDGASKSYSPTNPGVGVLDFGEEYWWRVDVSDGVSSSGWINGPSFTTDIEWPEPSFTWEQDLLSLDIIFDGSASDCAGCSYSWDFGDGVGTSNLEDPVYTYLAENDYSAVLTATSGGRSCNRTQVVTVGAILPLPIWEETAPF